MTTRVITFQCTNGCITHQIPCPTMSRIQSRQASPPEPKLRCSRCTTLLESIILDLICPCQRDKIKLQSILTSQNPRFTMQARISLPQRDQTPPAISILLLIILFPIIQTLPFKAIPKMVKQQRLGQRSCPPGRKKSSEAAPAPL